ncbi:MAG: hypothetical protein E6K79_06225 [Candidatus Eisenbacteria bacterium]|uniref:Uncharacterized protein n=1 Tax=Eiseniibacteriota bacterium TaxID=2212470 RepID=A0A538TMT1_UNCEI|nr:MAG: hypothetical protein E6K79_06225 [Candidatus Eisenbacteria bacterium]
MIGERVTEGWQVRLKSCGPMRYVSAAFLLFWLCGWAIGEGVALTFLAKGILALMNGAPFEEGRSPLQLGPALAAGGFLLLWLSLWTLGGIMAIGEVLRLLWGEDRLIVNAGGLTIVRCRGPFRSRREIPRDLLRRIVIDSPSGPVVAETPQGRIEITRLGTNEEREESAAALRSELGIREDAPRTDPVALPKGWAEVITPEGERAVTVDAATKRLRVRVVALAALAAGALAYGLVMESLHRVEVLPVAIIAVAGTVGVSWLTVWLARGRMEWRIGRGSLTLRRRFGSTIKDVFEGRRLELVVSRDSDSDEWIALEALGEGAAESRPEQWTRVSSKNRRRITSVLRDPSVPRLLGAWLSKAAGVPLEDRTRREARQAEITLTLDQLEKSGPVGRVAARLLGKAFDKTRKSA